MIGQPYAWNVTQEECARSYACDDLGLVADHALYRAIDIDASPAHVYRWLQQLRIAPYSYDWLDNFLLPSPRTLGARAASIAVGDRMMHVFRLLALEPGHTMTLGVASRLAAALFGELIGTYVVSERGSGARLFVKVNIRYPRSFYGSAMRGPMPHIDLFMTKKQLRTLKAYAERTAYVGSSN